MAAALIWTRAYDVGGATFEKYPGLPARGTKAELVQYYEDSNAAVWQRAATKGKDVAEMIRSVGLPTASHYLFQRSSPTLADTFFEELRGTTPESNAVISILRTRLFKDLYTARHERLKMGSKFALLLKAWNVWITGEQIGNLRVASSKNEKFPVVVVEKGHVRSVVNQ